MRVWMCDVFEASESNPFDGREGDGSLEGVAGIEDLKGWLGGDILRRVNLGFDELSI